MGNLFVTEERIVEETEKIIQELIFGTIRETNKEKIDRIKIRIGKLVSKSPKYLGHHLAPDQTLLFKLIHLFVEQTNEYEKSRICLKEACLYLKKAYLHPNVVSELLEYLVPIHREYDLPGGMFNIFIAPTENNEVKTYPLDYPVYIQNMETVNVRFSFLMNKQRFSIDSIDVFDKDGNVIKINDTMEYDENDHTSYSSPDYIRM